MDNLPFGVLIPPNELSNEEYHKLDGISASGLKKGWKDPKLFTHKDKLMRISSPALTMGTATHEALLEPDQFNMMNYKFTPANDEKVKVMINNGKVMFDYILSKTLNEMSLLVQDNGFVRKVRVDAYDPVEGIIYDLKSSRYNDEERFANDSYKLGYHIQSSFYIDTFRMAGLKVNAFAFLVVPSETPNEPFGCYVDKDLEEDGREQYPTIIQHILDHKKDGGERIIFKKLSMPQWRLRQLGIID
jgi:hypothetical protein